MSEEFKQKLKGHFAAWSDKLSTANELTKLDIIEKEYACVSYQSAWKSFLRRLVLDVVGTKLNRKQPANDGQHQHNSKEAGKRQKPKKASSL